MVVVEEPVSSEAAVAPLPSALIPAARASRSEPSALKRAEQAAEPPCNPDDSQPNESVAAEALRNRTITIIDGTSGKRHEIVIPDSASIDQQQAVTTRRGAGAIGPAGTPSGSLSPAR